MTKKAQYVYVLSNPAFSDDLVKIGFSDDYERRANELRSSGVPHAFEVEFAKLVLDAQRIEQTVHRKLRDFRVSNEREFFNCGVSKAIAVIKEVVEEFPNSCPSDYEKLAHSSQDHNASNQVNDPKIGAASDKACELAEWGQIVYADDISIHEAGVQFGFEHESLTRFVAVYKYMRGRLDNYWRDYPTAVKAVRQYFVDEFELENISDWAWYYNIGYEMELCYEGADFQHTNEFSEIQHKYSEYVDAELSNRPLPEGYKNINDHWHLIYANTLSFSGDQDGVLNISWLPSILDRDQLQTVFNRLVQNCRHEEWADLYNRGYKAGIVRRFAFSRVHGFAWDSLIDSNFFNIDKRIWFYRGFWDSIQGKGNRAQTYAAQNLNNKI